MDRVIAGYDSSPHAGSALAWAAAEARRWQAELHVLTVADPRARADDLRAHLRPELDRITGGLPAEHHVEHGDAAARLVGTCTADDLLVIGSRGRGPLAERLLGSVSHACLHTARCPVVIVREQPRPPRGVVLAGVDGSAAARHALTVAAGEARRGGAALHALHVVYWEHLGGEWIIPTVDDLVGWGKQLLEKELAETGVTALPEVIHGYPTDVLTRRSEHADLLVLGARGHSPLTTLLLGSTADHCARHARCPIMIVPAR
ncbi:universal stress protein [Amycolatopsis alkalitolerans]|uniref:Universal stress protein n=1 Tax=Amycolatopsis alkalitolerans TaxID=2547244 RepID=A0A5C4LSV1_9PSEU|nr:universal stress protein [Amycolatopsis alkalitolerans]TNC21575.1 universal stress protein [Amycolatopsis alkalitolerans]